MKIDEICCLSAAELGGLIRRKEVSPVEVVDAHIERIEALEPKLNSFITVAGDQARNAARTAEKEVARGGDLGPLHGSTAGAQGRPRAARAGTNLEGPKDGRSLVGRRRRT